VRYRALGKTGIEVCAYSLGAMLFGNGGNPDHGECIREDS
jgi:aryl-alcohol dehydrogenase-like predicted oxidoreductase